MTLINQIILLQEVDNKLFEIKKLLGDLPSKVEDLIQNEDGVKSILQDIAFMECVGMHPIVVHGGGKAISKALKEKGIFSKFIQGLRVTDSSSIKIVERVLNQEINPYLVDSMQ